MEVTGSNPVTSKKIDGSVPEWLMGADCKSAGFAYVGSNPTRPNIQDKSPCNSTVEYFLGKKKATSSTLVKGLDHTANAYKKD